MARRANAVLRYIRGLAAPLEQNAASDTVLVNRFIANKDNGAFSALVNRHGALVLQVCRRILGDGDDAEDALQATFLVLARKARSARSCESLASWLHGVARRVSLKARAIRARRLRLDMAARLAPTSGPDPLEELSCRELLETIDEEVQRLPEKQRLPLILCCLEGLSLEEAAGRLGWKTGAVKGRLQRGRARLHDRLVRRGLTLSAALAAVEAARGPASSSVVARLATAAVRGALVSTIGQTTPAEGISAAAAALARAVLKSMALTKLTIVTGLLLPLCLLAVGLVARGRELPPSTELSQSTPSPLPVRTVVIDDKPVEVADDADVPIEVKGRVLDPTGKPYAGANLYVGYASGGGSNLPPPQTALPLRAKSAADGHFQFTFARSELDARMLDNSSPAVIAAASGYGPEWSQIAGPGQAGTLTLKLVEDFSVNGRVLDPKGKPVAGAKIRVLNIISASAEEVTRFLGGVPTYATQKSWSGAFPERPLEVTADADGRFRLTGLGRDRIVAFDYEHPGPVNPNYAVARLIGSAPDSRIHGATFDIVATESRLVRGVCRDQATGKPVAGVRMSALNSIAKPQFTDVDGFYELSGRGAGDYIVAEPPGGQPYFAASATAPGTPGFDPITLDFDLVRGIPLVGKVQCSTGKKPPSAGRVEYYPLKTNTHAWKIQTPDYIPASSGLIQPDGSFQLVVLPGPGVVSVAASPRRSFTAALVDDRELSAFFGPRQGCLSPKNYHAISLINPKEDAEQWTLDVEVMKGIRLRGLLTDPNGQPLASARVMGLTAMGYGEYLEGSSFEITQMRPHEVRQVVFTHDEKKLGRILTVHAGETGPLDVRLEPWGSIKGRLVDKKGQPVPNGFIRLLIENIGLERGLSADRNGRFQGPLVPRARYSFVRAPWGQASDAIYLGEVTVESGQEKDVGDVSYDNPRFLIK
jgi:RNA polymerase sigma factor (sigma-70 family)